jgi:AcrR family transcriptional regulator
MEIEDLFGLPRRSLRDEQKDQTHAIILDIALALIRKGGDEAVTMRAVADMAGIAERTVYRHFENRDVLLRSAWRRMQDLVGRQILPQTADALIDRPGNLFPRLEQERELVRAYLYSAARRAARTRHDKERQQVMVSCVREELEYLDEPSLRRRAAIAEVIASPYAWELMRQSWGFSGKQAGKAAAEALEILLNRRLAY